MKNRIGKQTIIFNSQPSIKATASIAGKKEGDGPLAHEFDMILEDEYLGEKSWDKAESTLLSKTFELCLSKANFKPQNLDFVLAGDLQNQCTSSHYAVRGIDASFLGIYGACSTMSEGLLLSAMLVDSGYGENVLCGTSSHFCSAEKQFRFPLEYGGIRTPTAQWTVTGSGSAIVSSEDSPVKITNATIGKIVDLGVCDINNMGAAMAPAAADTLFNHFKATNTAPKDYDLILTGDLGVIGSDLLCDMMSDQGYDIYSVHNDCGKMIFDTENQDVHAGGSGCGCSASVFSSHIYKELLRGNLKRICLMATGALMNPQMVLGGESIPSIAHLVTIEA